MTYKKFHINNNWYMSFGDFLTLILCFFLVVVSSSFNKASYKEKINDIKKETKYTLKNDDFTFTLPESLDNKFSLVKLDNSLLYEEDKIAKAFILKLNNKDYVNNIDEFKNLLKSLSFSKDYKFKLLSFKNFENFGEFLAFKRQISDAKFDVSELKMSHNDENEIILRVYKKI